MIAAAVHDPAAVDACNPGGADGIVAVRRRLRLCRSCEQQEERHCGREGRQSSGGGGGGNMVMLYIVDPRSRCCIEEYKTAWATCQPVVPPTEKMGLIKGRLSTFLYDSPLKQTCTLSYSWAARAAGTVCPEAINEPTGICMTRTGGVFDNRIEAMLNN